MVSIADDPQGRNHYLCCLLSALGQDFLVIDRGFVIVDASDTLRAAGLKREDVLGRRCHEVSHGLAAPCSGPGEECAAEEVFRTGEALSRLHTHRGAGGSQNLVEVLFTPLRDAKGEVAWVVEAVRDVAETQRALAASDSRYRALFDNLPSGYAVHRIVTDGEGRPVDYVFLEANGAFERFTGLNRGEILGRPVTEVIPGIREAQPDLIARYGRVAREHVTDSFEMRFEPLDRWYSVTAFSMGPAAPGHFGTVFTDITHYKEAQHRLRQNEERYRRITEAVTDYLYTVRVQDGRAVETIHGPGCVAVTGYTTEDFAADPGLWLRMVHPEDREAVVTQAAQVLARGDLKPLEHRIVRKDGSTRWIRNTPVLSLDARGEVVSYDGLVQDVTELRALQAQFREAQKMEAIGQLAGGIAHDFNNLLTAIIGYSELLQLNLPEGDPSLESAEEIAKAAARAAALTGQLLAFSRRQILRPKVLNLNEVVMGTEKLLRRMIGEDIDLVTSLDPSLGLVEVDPVQIEQVLMNLAVNSRDAMPRGGRLTIETRNAYMNLGDAERFADMRPGPYVRLTVRDTGSGMSEETLSHMFEPFFTTKEVGKGTGLGLATVYGIVRQSAGHVGVESRKGEGTVFTISLPRVARGERDDGQVPLPEKLRRGQETVLVVEDADMVRNLARQILTRCGYTVLEARGGDEALDVCLRHGGTIDLLVTDVIMPGMSGRDVAARLASIQPTMKVLYMSGHTEDYIVRHGVLDESIAFLQKPFTPRDMALKVRQVLDSPSP